MRNRGSTQSLKPNDDGEAHPESPASGRAFAVGNKSAAHEARRASVASRGGVDRPHMEQDSGNGNPPLGPSAVEGQTNQVIALATAQARATLRRTQLSKKRAAAAESMLSAEGVTPSKYRNRNLVMVYYDSYVQSFFEELVKFVSASRNMMRKAKMAAKVAQIKKMAELEVPDGGSSSEGEDSCNGATSMDLEPSQLASPDDKLPATTDGVKGDLPDGKGGPQADATQSTPDQNTNNGPSTPISPSRSPYARASMATNGHGNGNGHRLPSQPLKPSSVPNARPKLGGGYSSFSSFGLGLGDPQQQPDVFDELDKSLESVQSMCEHAAHQFLRDGDCSDEVVKIKDQLSGTRTSAEQQIQRMLDRDDSLKAKLSEAPVRARSYRPQSMRRGASLASASPAAARAGGGAAGLASGGFDGNRLTADPEPGPFGAAGGVLEVDDGSDDGDQEPPRLQYRSTRAMGALKTVSPGA